MIRRKEHEEDIINSIEYTIERLDVYWDIYCRTSFELGKMLKNSGRKVTDE